jgi:hypothetical protein
MRGREGGGQGEASPGELCLHGSSGPFSFTASIAYDDVSDC